MVFRRHNKEDYADGLKIAERRGERDRKRGVPFVQNPYKNMDHRISWIEGWTAQQARETAMFPVSEALRIDDEAAP
jgi:hypothetical protein